MASSRPRSDRDGRAEGAGSDAEGLSADRDGAPPEHTITAVATLPVRAGCEAEFAAAFLRERVLEHAVRYGMREARLLRPQLEGPFLVISAWPDKSSYAAWGTSPENSRISGAIAPLLDGRLLTSTFELVDFVTAAASVSEPDRYPRKIT